MDIKPIADYIESYYDGNLALASRELGINRDSLYRWITAAEIVYVIDSRIYLPYKRRDKK